MPSREELLVAIRAEVRGLRAGLEDGKKALQDFASTTNTVLQRVSASFGAVMVGVYAFKRLQSAASGAIDAAKKQIQAEAQLTSALGYTSRALKEQAAALQRQTTFGDEATLAAQARIASIVREEREIARIIPAVQDFAAATGMDLVSAADLYTKAIGGNVGALSRYNVTIGKTSSQQERISKLIERTAQMYGGMARALAETPAGKLEQQANLLMDMKETIGNHLIPLQIEWNRHILETVQGWIDIIDKISFARRAQEASKSYLEMQRDYAFRRARDDENAIARVKQLAAEGHKMVLVNGELLSISAAIAKLEKDRAIALRTAGAQAKELLKLLQGPDVKTTPKAAPKELDKDAIKRAEEATKQAVADIQLHLQRYVSSVQISLASIEKSYADGLIDVENYYAIKRDLLQQQAQEEIAALKEIALLTKSSIELTEQQARIEQREAELTVQLIELDKEEAAAKAKLNEERDRELEKSEAMLQSIRERVAAGEVALGSFREQQAAELQALKNRHAEELAELRRHTNEVARIREMQSLQQQETIQLTQQQEVESLSYAVGTAQALGSQLLDIYSRYYDYVRTQEQSKIEAELENMRLAGASAEALEARRAELQAAANVRARAAWEKQKRAEIAMAIINGAQAVLNAANTKPFFPLGLAMMALAGVLTGIEIAKIRSQNYPGMAEGGLITVGTTGRADDVPIRASRGEFIAPASSVEYYGAGVYEALRQRRVPRELFDGISLPSNAPAPRVRFAEGGLVDTAANHRVQGRETTIVNFLDPNLMDRYLATPRGQRAIVNVIERRSFEINKALGG